LLQQTFELLSEWGDTAVVPPSEQVPLHALLPCTDADDELIYQGTRSTVTKRKKRKSKTKHQLGVLTLGFGADRSATVVLSRNKYETWI
jgi:hypothetical protein